MAVSSEDPKEPTRLTTSREPVGPASTKAGAPGTRGDEAFKDAVAVVLVAWAVLFLLVLSLRSYNV